MSALGPAYAIAVALYAREPKQQIDFGDAEERLYHTVEAVTEGTDEYKADLYSRLAERLKADTPFIEAVDVIKTAINATDMAVRRG